MSAISLQQYLCKNQHHFPKLRGRVRGTTVILTLVTTLKMPLFPHLPITDRLPSAPGAPRQCIPWMLCSWAIDTKACNDFIRFSYIDIGGINAARVACSVSSVSLTQREESMKEGSLTGCCLTLGRARKYCNGSWSLCLVNLLSNYLDGATQSMA